jgi:hypothetical protein
LCFRVEEVHDTAYPEYKDASQTVIISKVQVTGDNTGTDVVVSDQAATTADPAVVDGSLGNLWLSSLLVPSRDHGFLSPADVESGTREPPHPAFGAPLSKLLYFDKRHLADNSWGGWDKINDDCPNLREEEACVAKSCRWSGGYCDNQTMNFLSDFLVYMITDRGCTNFMSGDTKCRESHTIPPTDCAVYTDQPGCMAHNCTYVFNGNGNEGTCMGMHTLELMWRETVTTGPAELVAVGTVFHSLLIDYDEQGVIRHAAEDVGPDSNPGGPMKAIGANVCINGAPCAQAQLNLDDAGWGSSKCTF